MCAKTHWPRPDHGDLDRVSSWSACVCTLFVDVEDLDTTLNCHFFIGVKLFSGHGVEVSGPRSDCVRWEGLFWTRTLEPLPDRTRHREQLFRRPRVALGRSDVEAPAMIVCRVGVLLISGCCSRQPKFESWILDGPSLGCVIFAKRCVLGSQGDRQAHGHHVDLRQEETARWILGLRSLERGPPAKVWTDIQAVSFWSLSRSVLRELFLLLDQREGSHIESALWRSTDEG